MRIQLQPSRSVFLSQTTVQVAGGQTFENHKRTQIAQHRFCDLYYLIWLKVYGKIGGIWRGQTTSNSMALFKHNGVQPRSEHSRLSAIPTFKLTDVEYLMFYPTNA